MTDRTDPFAEIEQLFEQFPQIGIPFGERVPVDLIDTGDELLVRADLPGRDPDAITVQLDDNRHLHLDVDAAEGKSNGRFVTRERSLGELSRSITLPAAVDESATEANYDRGVLTVHLPKLTGDSEGTDIPVN